MTVVAGLFAILVNGATVQSPVSGDLPFGRSLDTVQFDLVDIFVSVFKFVGYLLAAENEIGVITVECTDREPAFMELPP